MLLRLVGGFAASHDGEPVNLPPSGARLLALLALQRHGLPRACVAGTLWPDKNEERATANLRSTLWRLAHNRSRALVEVGPGVLTLGAGLDVDLDRLRHFDGLAPDAAGALLHDLLEGWDDAWVVPHRIRWRQARLHLLDRLCRSLITAERYGEAAELARLVLRAEPLRESVVRVLIEAEVGRHRPAAAVAEIDRYRTRLATVAGARPSAQFTRLATMADRS